MRYLYIICCITLLPLFLSAQITLGINTDAPEGVFHIDGLNNNSYSPNKYDDDVLFDTSGRLGIGTNAPTAKVDIRSATANAFRLEESGQANTRVLVSNGLGEGAWKVPPQQGTFYTWKVHQPAYTYSYSRVQVVGTATASGTLAGFTPNSNSTLSVPKGQYILMVSGDNSGNEYPIFSVSGVYADGSTVNVLDFPYEHWLNSTSIYVQFTDNVSLAMYTTGLNANKAMWSPAITNLCVVGVVYPRWYQITFLKLA